MNNRVKTIACALLLSALVVPASQAGDQRSPGKRHQIVAHARSSAFAGLGHEGSALRTVESARTPSQASASRAAGSRRAGRRPGSGRGRSSSRRNPPAHHLR